MTPENSLTFENTFENEQEIETGLLTLERFARRDLGMTNMAFPAVNGVYTDYISPSDPALLLENNPERYVLQWIHLYDVIAMANVPLPYIDKVEMPQERRDFYKGQVYFTKALDRKSVV